MKKKKFIIILIGLFLVCYVKTAKSEEKISIGEKEQKLSKVYRSNQIVRVDFYKKNYINNKGKAHIGYAILDHGNLFFKVENKRLRKMLNSDFHTISTVKQNGSIKNKFVTYKTGTLKHLESVIEHCKDISCIAKIRRPKIFLK